MNNILKEINQLNEDEFDLKTYENNLRLFGEKIQICFNKNHLDICRLELDKGEHRRSINKLINRLSRPQININDKNKLQRSINKLINRLYKLQLDINKLINDQNELQRGMNKIQDARSELQDSRDRFNLLKLLEID